MKVKMLVMGVATIMANSLWAANTGVRGSVLRGFLYDSEAGCVRWGSIAFLFALFVAIGWAQVRANKKHENLPKCKVKGEVESEDQSAEATKSAKTFGRAPKMVQVVSTLLILEAFAGLALSADPRGVVGILVRFFIAKAVVCGSKGARTFLIAIGVFALLGGFAVLFLSPPGKGAPLVLMLLYGGVFNLLMGVLLYSKSADEWLK